MENLTKHQKSVLKLIFELKKSEEEALTEAGIAKRVYDGWFRQKLWSAEYEKRLKTCQRTADLIIANFKDVAAIKLVNLCTCEKEAVARTACLDILNMEIETDEPQEVERKYSLRPETREAIMKIMAAEKKESVPGSAVRGEPVQAEVGDSRDA